MNGNNNNKKSDNVNNEIVNEKFTIKVGEIRNDVQKNGKRNFIYANLDKVFVWITTKTDIMKHGQVDVSFHDIQDLKSVKIKSKTYKIGGTKKKQLSIIVDGSKVGEFAFFESKDKVVE